MRRTLDELVADDSGAAWADTDAGRRLLAGNSYEAIDAVCDALEAFKEHNYWERRGEIRRLSSVFKRLLRRKLGYDWPRLARLLVVVVLPYRGMPKLTVLGHVERYLESNPSTEEIRQALQTARERMWDDKERERLDRLVSGEEEKKVPGKFLGKDPWVMAAKTDIAASADKKTWNQLLEHTLELTSTRPTQKWSRDAQALVSQIGEATYRERILRWLNQVPARADADAEGLQSARSFEERNAIILRGLMWALPTDKPDLEMSNALHAAGAACYAKVFNHGPRSTLVGNACVGVLAECGDDDSVRAIFDLGFTIDNNSVRNVIKRVIAEVAEARELTPEQLEEVLDAKAASLARRPHEDLEDTSGLLLQIYENPHDDQVRLVYADHLTAKGDPHGEFIVLQLQDKQTTAQRKLEKKLLAENKRKWLGDLEPVFQKKDLHYRRGFLAAGRLVRDKPSELHRLTGHPAWSTLEELKTNRHVLPDRFLRHAVMRRGLRGLMELSVENFMLLCKDPTPWRLTNVGIGWIPWDQVSAAMQDVFKTAPGLPEVRALGIEYNPFPPDELAWWLESPFGQQLKELTLEPQPEHLMEWLTESASLMARLEKMSLRARWGMNWHYDFVRSETGRVAATVRYRGTWGDAHTLEQVVEALRVFGKERLEAVNVTMPREIQRNEADLAPLTELCNSFDLKELKLPKASAGTA